MLNKLKYACAAALLCLVTLSSSVRAELTIDIDLLLDNAIKIAVVPFEWNSKARIPLKITNVINSDLNRSGRFSTMKENDMLSLPHQTSDVNYAVWRNLKKRFLVVGKIEPLAQKQYQVQFQLLNVDTGEQMTGHSFKTKRNQLRRLSHHISDLIYEAVTGDRGAFDTYLSYVTVTQNRKGENQYRLSISDSDGYNEQVLFQSNQPIVRPAWSPDGKKLAYVSYKTGRPQIYIQDVFKRHTRQITHFQGSSLSPAWSPDGRRMAMSLSKDGNAEIYIMDLKTRRLHRVTRSYGVDIEPAWFPDGQSIVFTSDRGGRPQIYRQSINARGGVGRAQRLTFDGVENLRASVSPDGERITMVHNSGGRYRIAVLDLEADQLSILTDGRLDESPGFAPNGGMLIYASEANGRGVLAAVSSDGRASHKLRLQRGDVREPAWSPYKQN